MVGCVFWSLKVALTVKLYTLPCGVISRGSTAQHRLLAVTPNAELSIGWAHTPDVVTKATGSLLGASFCIFVRVTRARDPPNMSRSSKSRAVITPLELKTLFGDKIT